MAFSPDMLRTIHLIAATGSFVMAADMQNKVPSAISYNVKKWEEELGFKLFDRKARQIKLTTAGKYYIEQTKWMLEAYDSLVKKSNLISSNDDITFTIALNNIIQPAAIPPLVDFLSTQFPATQLTLTTEVYNGTWDALYGRRADLVIGAPHTAPKLEGIICEPIGELEWDFVVGSQHPLSQHSIILSTDILRQYPSIVVKDTSIHLPKLDTWSLEGQRIIYVPSLDTAIELIEKGIGIGYIPHHKIITQLNEGKLIKKAIEEHKLATKLFYAWRTDSQSSLMKHCIEYIKSNLHTFR
ncbi:LysR substrate-binding domain-containing protein [Thorsellia anophelis]|uniref:DNA-binding transcriptional regulator, LysR family n=1 Tax=Thorsellia anophelis DSM 18579 TaxID=1123402 RepID=A0A1I0F862_9GAMM|nr:LysR substrate-binding domain-containing protein [Thorsellia anophelis]SET54285.1 DNA-binding transcriptional regulator, LysR family [Thorsellia anophelis DSM 18579]